MKHMGITGKLFIVFSLVFSLFLGAVILGQSLFFETFYLKHKISVLEKNIDNFSGAYAQETWDEQQIIEHVNEFTNKNNAQIAVLDRYGSVKYTPMYYITILTDEEKTLRIPLNGIAQLNNFRNLKLTNGSEIAVEGFLNYDQTAMAALFSIESGQQKWEGNIPRQFFNTVGDNVSIHLQSGVVGELLDFQISGMIDSQESIKVVEGSDEQIHIETVEQMLDEAIVQIPNESVMKITRAAPFQVKSIQAEKIAGTIIDMNLPSKIEQISNYSNNLLWSSIQHWIWQTQSDQISDDSDNDIYSFHYNAQNNDIDNLAFVKPIVTEAGMQEYVFAITSLQPVGEAVAAMNNFYVYVFLLALLLVIGASLFFSRVISRPLINMNRVATKMAGLDFSEECTVTSEDEMGTLAKNLNHLSNNLQTSLTNLQEANRQLQIDIEKERDLEKMRKEFVSSVSHEFKTPLGVIKAFAEGIKDNVVEEKKAYYTDVILDEVDKMDELVLDLLELAKLESKTQTLELSEFDIAESIKNIEARISKTVNEKDIDLSLAFSDQEIVTIGDKRKIEQVIANILGNAIRHTPVDGRIEVGIQDVADEVLIYIENTGAHIPEAELTKIWDRFYRIEKARDRKTGGTGLGLAIVKNILELHESRFGAVNTELGVSFYFTLKKVQRNYS